MCVLTSIGIATGLSVAGTILGTSLGVVSAIQENKAEIAQYQYQAQLQKQNEEITREKARAEAQEGLNKERQERVKNLYVLGKTKTSLASSGADISFGTSLDLIEDTQIQGELDILNIREDTKRRVEQYDNSILGYVNKANYYETLASDKQDKSLANAINTGFIEFQNNRKKGLQII